MTKENQYITSEYFCKSLNFLFPLTGLKQKLEFKAFSSYLFWEDEVEENIFDYKIFVYYQEDIITPKFQKFEETQILKNSKLISCYTVDDGIVYLFDLISYSRDIFYFLEGKYSKFSKEAKKVILEHFGVSDDNKIIPGRPIYQTLYPEKFFNKVANDLGDYVTLKDLYEVGELTDRYNLEDETLTKKIIHDCECTNIKRIEYKI